MPEVADTTPEHLRPYLFHGVDLQWPPGGKQALGTCPFCNREKHFSVQVDTGLWRCYVCGEGNEKGGGNAKVFLQRLWSLSSQSMPLSHYAELAANRWVEEETLILWEVVKSITTGDWLVPGYTAEGKMVQLYRYLETEPGKRRLIPTPTMGHQLHGRSLYRNKHTLYLCEGPWDGMALWEQLRATKWNGEELWPTGNAENSLLADADVLAVPGCNVFFDNWLPLFAGKCVNLMYDSDHTKKHPTTGNIIPAAGHTGMKRVAGLLLASREPPAELNWLPWGPEGYDPALPSGCDVRDVLRRSGLMGLPG
jgi:hypothetical protein